MGFVGVYKVLYDYTPQADAELPISEGDLLYVLEKSDVDDWWKAKRKAGAEDEEEPVGLVPNNYVEEVRYPGPVALEPYIRTDLTDSVCARLNPSLPPEPCTNTRDKPTRNSPSPKMLRYISSICPIRTGFW